MNTLPLVAVLLVSTLDLIYSFEVAKYLLKLFGQVLFTDFRIFILTLLFLCCSCFNIHLDVWCLVVLCVH